MSCDVDLDDPGRPNPEVDMPLDTDSDDCGDKLAPSAESRVLQRCVGDSDGLLKPLGGIETE